MDYFKLRLFDKTKKERATYAGAGFMYQYQMQMNPRPHREILENKIQFLQHFAPFVGRKWVAIKDWQEQAQVLRELLLHPSGKLVLKYSRGQAGKEIKIITTAGLTLTTLRALMQKHKFDMVEEFVVQHDVLKRIAPRGLNTVRIITQYHQEEVHIIGTSLRLSVENPVDNIAAGGVAVLIDRETGFVDGPARYADPSKPDITRHPITNEKISGFYLPFWTEIIKMVKDAARLTPGNRSVGWDIAITNQGPVLIEGNHNWCNAVWQLPLQQGMKPVLKSYLSAVI